MSALNLILFAVAALSMAIALKRWPSHLPARSWRLPRVPRRYLLGFSGLALALALGAQSPASGADLGQTKTVGGLTVYLGIVPAEIVRSHLPSHPEAQAHGGAPSGRHEYHVLVAVFDAASGARIEDAKVGARVSSVGLAGPYKTLEPMKVADTITYGNYFELPGGGAYTVDIDVDRPQGPVKVKFKYGH